MVKKLIAIASGDWHGNDWKQFNEGDKRLYVTSSFLSHIFGEAEDNGVDLLFTGDMFHTPAGLSTKTFHFMSGVFRVIDDNFKSKLYGIDGNHDMSETNTLKKSSPSNFKAMCNCFPNLLHDVGLRSVLLKKQNVKIFGAPFLTHNMGLSGYINTITEEAKQHSAKGGKNILLLHSDIWGARDTNGREIGSVENIPRNLGKFFKPFDLVLCGHIHQHAELWDKKVFMIGAPYQQRKSDKDSNMGYYHIYDDMSVKFIKYEAPVFKEYQEGDDHPDDGSYWVKVPKIETRKEGNKEKFSPLMSRSRMAKKYAKYYGIKSKLRINALIEILNKVDNE